MANRSHVFTVDFDLFILLRLSHAGFAYFNMHAYLPLLAANKACLTLSVGIPRLQCHPDFHTTRSSQ